MIVALSRRQLLGCLPDLVRLWPEDGQWDEGRRLRLARVLARLPDDDGRPIRIDGRISLHRLAKTGRRMLRRRADFTTIPWKYQKYLQRGTPLRKQAIRIRPGGKLPLAIGGVETVAHINSVRRINKYGKPFYLKTDLTINTEHLPIILDRESKCDCLYCGTRPVSDETSCRACGAPLPDC